MCLKSDLYLKSKYLDFVCIFYHVFWNLLRILKCNYVFIQSSLITGLKFKKLEKDIDIMRKLRYTKYRSDEHENMKYT